MKVGDKVLYTSWGSYRPQLLVTIVKEDIFNKDQEIEYYWVDCDVFDAAQLVHVTRLEVVDDTELNDVLF